MADLPLPEQISNDLQAVLTADAALKDAATADDEALVKLAEATAAQQATAGRRKEATATRDAAVKTLQSDIASTWPVAAPPASPQTRR